MPTSTLDVRTNIGQSEAALAKLDQRFNELILKAQSINTGNLGRSARDTQTLNTSVQQLNANTQQLNTSARRAQQSFTVLGNQGSRSMGRIRTQTRSIATDLRAIRTLAGGGLLSVGIFGTIRGFTRIADESQRISTLFRQITDSAGQLTNEQERIHQLALDLRAPVEEVARVYSRVAMSVEGAFPLDDVERFTRAVVQLGIATGSTSIELTQGLRQLTQGLASGILAGDELRSVREGLPAFARELARALDVPLGQLRELGRLGQLTTDVVFQAGTSPGLQQRAQAAFDDVQLTFDQVFTRFRDSLVEELGQFSETGNIIESLDKTLQDKAVPAIVELTKAALALADSPLFTLGNIIALAVGGASLGGLSSRRQNLSATATAQANIERQIDTRSGGVLSEELRISTDRSLSASERGAAQERYNETIRRYATDDELQQLERGERYRQRVAPRNPRGFAGGFSRLGQVARNLSVGPLSILIETILAGELANQGLQQGLEVLAERDERVNLDSRGRRFLERYREEGRGFGFNFDLLRSLYYSVFDDSLDPNRERLTPEQLRERISKLGTQGLDQDDFVRADIAPEVSRAIGRRPQGLSRREQRAFDQDREITAETLLRGDFRPPRRQLTTDEFLKSIPFGRLADHWKY